MTKEEYRDHMRRYSRETMVMSFVVTNHRDYQAMRAAGMEIVGYLLEDLIDPDWYCDTCYGFGYKFVAQCPTCTGSRDVPLCADIFHSPAGATQTNDPPAGTGWPPESTGDNCPKCGGKGNINSWACMMLLGEALGDKRPKIENWMRGRHDHIVKVWQKWGEQNGYLPKRPEQESTSTWRQKLARLLFPSQ